MLFLVYNTSFDKSILTLKTCLCAIIFLGKKGEKHEKEKAFKKERLNRYIGDMLIYSTLMMSI